MTNHNPTFEVITKPENMPQGWREIVKKSKEVALKLNNNGESYFAGLYSSSNGAHFAFVAGRSFLRNCKENETPEDYLHRVTIRAKD